MKSREIRKLFFSYFTKQGHEQVSSSSLVPENDPTLLFANAGMNQFKGVFLGHEKRPYNRAVTAQKCVRAGGKHNDLENVGFTARHHTFFEMLGNFSFGPNLNSKTSPSYFKKEAIHFAWELLTKELAIPKEKLTVTVFQNDDEAADIWHKQEGVARDRIYRFGEKDNFWRMGDTGPCGPCSEIFYDHGPEADLDPAKPSVMGGDGDRFVEIWNNVFMQFNETEKGRTPLIQPSVDTGAGIERWAAMLQGKPNNYDTDIFLPIIQKAASISKIEYVSDYKILSKDDQIREQAAALRVLADHARATTFLLADGVLPSNEGRGYVLRRIMRRAIRYGRTLATDDSLFVQTVQSVIQEMADIYPYLSERENHILTTVRDEIQRFLTTLDQGTEILIDAMKKLSARNAKVLDGETAFKLYDTFGFPIDLTKLMAKEKGFQVDEAGFEHQMAEARAKAKSASGSKFKAAKGGNHLASLAQKIKTKSGPTVFLGYHSTSGEGTVLGLSDGSSEVRELATGTEGLLVLNRTPFYGESGGQIGDRGVLRSALPQAISQIEVLDTIKVQDIFLHHIRVLEGTVTDGQTLNAEVRRDKRKATAANHSATHLLHAALRKVLGTHVTQAGSLVTEDHLRFDFTHSKALSREELREIEALVNSEIDAAIPVDSQEMSHADAMKKGAMALFGEKYGDQVRVIEMGDFSTELCGGTHVNNTSEIRLFKIVSEGGVSAGVRRIDALTGTEALNYLNTNTEENLHAKELAGAGASAAEYIESLRAKIKDLEKELKKIKSSSIDVESLMAGAQSFEIKGVSGKFLTALVEIDDREVLSKLADQLRDKLGTAAVCLVGLGPDGASGDKHPIIATVSKNLTAHLSAGKILGEVAKEMGGRGGGRPDFAQGAGDRRSNAEKGFIKAKTLLA